jgi:hypothetical protein
LRTVRKLAVAIVAIAILFFMFNPLTIHAQDSSNNLQPDVGEALAAIQNAESAGATQSEVSPLVTMLNDALQSRQRALSITMPEGASERIQLFRQINQTLATVQGQADELATVASHRTYMHKLGAYAIAAIAAILGTAGCAFTVACYEKYRIKRVFQMRVRPK